MPFWQFFRQGQDGRALVVRPSRIPHRISKILFALSADELLAMLEGKIRVTPFLKVQSGKITVCARCHSIIFCSKLKRSIIPHVFCVYLLLFFQFRPFFWPFLLSTFRIHLNLWSSSFRLSNAEAFVIGIEIGQACRSIDLCL